MAAPQIIVSGLVEHSQMDAAQVLAKVQSRFPRASAAGLDFVVPLMDCEAEFFCVSSTNLEFRVKALVAGAAAASSSSRTVTAAEMLVRATESLWGGLEASLNSGRRRGRPTLVRCSIEDTQSRTTLLACETVSPLRSSGAKLAFAIGAVLTLAAIVLIFWQTVTPHSKEARESNILGISISLFVSAGLVQLPIFANWIEWKKELSWKYVRSVP
ncbi:hypothetical protein [Streptomyces sp. ISL-98]|uniref:hypothetical protein n=1 Tax=Streptomyces sp. ISL-98 TaxID=2819192 RepID=UPI001BE682FB|nr:hypothetical protein [Streptomyces sp. ISL-98]